MKKKILIAGSTGYLGNLLLHELNKDYWVETSDFRAETVNIDQQVDVVINCIGKTPDIKEWSYNEYEKSNVQVVKKIYEAFINSNAKLLIHFSSISAVEEEEFNGHMDEDTLCNPKSNYGITKRMAEVFLLEKVNELKDKKIVILRPTRIHGPNDKGTIYSLYNFLSKGIPYPFGSVDNARSFLGMDNLYFFIKQLIKKNETIESGIYNVNDDEPLSTLRIVQLIKENSKKKIFILNIPKFVFNTVAKIGDKLKLPVNSLTLKKITSSRIVSNNKIKQALEINRLPFSAEECLLETIKSFK
jgi:nucleoside-diphosphate-sugar epimerase